MVKRKNDLAVALGAELIVAGETSSYLLMIVNLAIDSQHMLGNGREQRLSARLWVNYAQTLMRQNSRTADIDAAPVRTAVTDFLTHTQSFLSELRRILLDVKDRNNSTHNIFFLIYTIIYKKRT